MSVHSISINANPSYSARIPKLGQWLQQAWRFNRTLTLGSVLNVVLIPVVLLALWLGQSASWRVYG